MTAPTVLPSPTLNTCINRDSKLYFESPQQTIRPVSVVDSLRKDLKEPDQVSASSAIKKIKINMKFVSDFEAAEDKIACETKSNEEIPAKEVTENVENEFPKNKKKLGASEFMNKIRKSILSSTINNEGLLDELRQIEEMINSQIEINGKLEDDKRKLEEELKMFKEVKSMAI